MPSDAVFDDFLARNRSKILQALTVALAQREPPIDPGQLDAWTESRRMAANLEAMQLLVSKPPGSHTVEERRVLARYSGWGGLSIDKAQAAFPPSLQVDTRALIHEYYTPSPLVAEIARVTQPLLPDLVGLDGVIRAIEPSAGIGRFILAFDALGGAPIRWTAVEYSALAAALLSAVRPGLTVFTGPFERWVAQHWDEEVGRVNLVVSNPPFGQRGEAAFEDRDRSYREKTAMAYFLRRGLDLLAPGGLGIFIVPMGFMSDPKRRKLRETILLGNHVATAFRLPSQLRLPDGRQRDHFPSAHNVTDLIFFRRRAGVLAELDAEDVPVADGRYFEMVPRHVLGEIDTSYRLAVIGPPVRLPDLIERPICQDCRIRVAAPRIVAKDTVDPADPRVASAQALARRVDAYLAAVAGARADDPALLWPELVDALRGWTARHGNPYDAQNIRVLAKDRDLARTFLRAFETDGNLIPGLRERPQAAAPAIPSGDLLALAEHIYRQERGLSVPRLLQEHTARGGKDTREAALSLIMRAGWCVDGPGLTLLLPEADYYTGDLWSRYDRAVQHPGNPQAEEQARRLLTTIRPALLHDLGEYSVREGWVPLPLIADWLGDTVNGGYPPLELIREGGLVQVRGIDYEDIDGHPRLAPLTINFLGWLNHDKVNFTPERKKLQSLAEARDEKIAAWSRDFRDWILGAPERQRILLAAYNRVARGFVVPTYGDDPIYLARWTTDPKKQLFDYQRAGVRRLLSNRGGILVYDVGVGKTFTALATIAAARQEGWVRRPVVLVPNSLILQWRNEIAAVLPDYRVLLVGTNLIHTEIDGQIVETAETDKPEQRAQKWARFQAGEYDLALLTYSSMSRTKLDMDAATAIVHDTPAIMRQLALARRNIIDKDPKNRTERERAILEEGIPAWILDRLELPGNWEYDGDIKWDDLGIDLLVIDEIHNFKNLFKPEPREYGVPAFMGSPGEGSDRAWQLCFRTAAIRRRSGGAGIIGLSATPAKNSPTELYTAVSYVNPRAWTDLKIHDAEQFIDRFCIIEARPVVTVGMTMETRSAMVGFKNLIDLRAILTRLLEMRSAEAMAAQGRLKKPRAREELVRVDLDTAQREKTAMHADAFAEKAANGGGNMALGLIVRLGLVAIHAQLDEGYSWDNALGGADMPAPDSFRSPKFIAVAERIVATPGCGHIVFLEPLAAQLWLREVLVEFGIPRAKIALLNAQSAKQATDRVQLADDFNKGRYIVMIANSVGGEGANLQRRTCAVHNVDLPWDPMTRRQRNGRADRQGNELDAIVIYDYLARSSGDGPRFAKIQGKGTWIDQVMESEDDIVSNPSAMVEVSPIELIADLTTDPAKTRGLLEQLARQEAAARRGKLLRQVARLMRSADARFRAAERAEEPLEAARLRQEGQAEITNLRAVDASIWPFFDQARAIEKHPSL
ncbi:MAG: DEAD/DEAH box helicase family protein, partial [Myxococcales bacterium]|nr:DEAD/DEAH box helicase family protein [Myxococcales bacterium]